MPGRSTWPSPTASTFADAEILPSVGSVGDAFDNALVESVIGLFKTEIIKRLGPWRTADAVEYAVLEWVDWFNHRRLLGPLGYIPPAEAEADYYRANVPRKHPRDSQPNASDDPTAVQFCLLS